MTPAFPPAYHVLGLVSMGYKHACAASFPGFSSNCLNPLTILAAHSHPSGPPNSYLSSVVGWYKNVHLPCIVPHPFRPFSPIHPIQRCPGDLLQLIAMFKMFKSLLAISSLSLLAVASPQYGYGSPPSGGSGGSSSSSAASAAPSAPPSTTGQINVDVAAGGQLVFNPSNINATVGTLITFFFPSGSLAHSVTQSTFSDPCTPLTGNGTGFDSGLTTGKEFTLNVTDASTPIWFFCKNVGHCAGGMVGAINAPSTGSNTFDAFQSKAKSLGSSAPAVSDTGAVTGGVGAIATAPPSASGTGSAPAPTGSSGSSGGSSSGAGHLAVSSGLGLVAIAAAVVLA